MPAMTFAITPQDLNPPEENVPTDRTHPGYALIKACINRGLTAVAEQVKQGLRPAESFDIVVNADVTNHDKAHTRLLRLAVDELCEAGFCARLKCRPASGKQPGSLSVVVQR